MFGIIARLGNWQLYENPVTVTFPLLVHFSAVIRALESAVNICSEVVLEKGFSSQLLLMRSHFSQHCLVPHGIRAKAVLRALLNRVIVCRTTSNTHP